MSVLGSKLCTIPHLPQIELVVLTGPPKPSCTIRSPLHCGPHFLPFVPHLPCLLQPVRPTPASGHSSAWNVLPLDIYTAGCPPPSLCPVSPSQQSAPWQSYYMGNASSPPPVFQTSLTLLYILSTVLNTRFYDFNKITLSAVLRAGQRQNLLYKFFIMIIDCGKKKKKRPPK